MIKYGLNLRCYALIVDYCLNYFVICMVFVNKIMSFMTISRKKANTRCIIIVLAFNFLLHESA